MFRGWLEVQHWELGLDEAKRCLVSSCYADETISTNICIGNHSYLCFSTRRVRIRRNYFLAVWSNVSVISASPHLCISASPQTSISNMTHWNQVHMTLGVRMVDTLRCKSSVALSNGGKGTHVTHTISRLDAVSSTPTSTQLDHPPWISQMSFLVPSPSLPQDW